VLPFFWGTGANGKGVFTLVQQGLLGDADAGGYALSAPDGFLMAGRDGAHPTEIARLRGARLVVCSEQTSGKRFDESKVKRLTGGDVLTGRFMRGDFFDFTPSHLTVVLSNHLPAVREGGPSFWRRVRRIPFLNVVPEDKRVEDLHEQLLQEEGPAILGWAIQGAVEVLKHGLQDPPAVLAATEEYRISEDSLASFVRDECLTGPNYWCKISDLRARYERHCEEMGAEPLSGKALGMRLATEYPVKSDKHSRYKSAFTSASRSKPKKTKAVTGDTFCIFRHYFAYVRAHTQSNGSYPPNVSPVTRSSEKTKVIHGWFKIRITCIKHDWQEPWQAAVVRHCARCGAWMVPLWSRGPRAGLGISGRG
jgi:P4 family phage/plasmid primase-like protien